jgi:two-component system phosphate regulon sensor histidine kinase PhoR
MLLSLVFVGMIIFAFSWMIFSFKKQKQLSDIKSDFVNNMTHELKTPISTISLASEMLLNSNGNLPDEKKQKYTRMIFDENMRLQQQVEQVLQMAILEKGSFKLELSVFDAHDVIEKCINRFDLVIKNTNGRIVFQPVDADSLIEADLTHFQNVVCNLLDNAVKYSGSSPDIVVSTAIVDKRFVISFKDKGIGISHENQKMIFEKLYRVPTGNIHNVKGFGLGLYYVKTIIEALGGEVRVHSEVNKGSTFEILMPCPVKSNTDESKS